MASDETAHLDIFIPPQKGLQDDQYLAGYVHGTGTDEVLSRREGSQSSEGIIVGDSWAVKKRGWRRAPNDAVTEPGEGSTYSGPTIHHPVKQVHPKWKKTEAQRDCVMCQSPHKLVSGTIRIWIPGGSDGKESAYNAEDAGSGRSPGEGNGYPLQYHCLENPMDRGTWQATVPRIGLGSQRVRHDWVTNILPTPSPEIFLLRGWGWRCHRASTGWVRTDSGHRKRSKDQIRPRLHHGIWLFLPQGVKALVSEGWKEHCFLFAFRVNKYMLKGKSAKATPETIPLRVPVTFQLKQANSFWKGRGGWVPRNQCHTQTPSSWHTEPWLQATGQTNPDVLITG